MKKMKKLVSLMLAVVMVLAMTTIVFADGTTYSITINNETSGHTYEVYQIFTGDLSSDNKLSNVKWGTGIADVTVGADATSAVDELLAGNNPAAEKIASFLEKYELGTTDQSLTYNETNKNYSISNLVPGYYLVKDADNSLAGKDDAYTQYIVQVVKDVTMSPKSAKPSVDKQVQDETADAETGSTDGWGETADHAINESFQFKLTATLPADTDFAAYSTYKVQFTDTMSRGVVFENIASVTVDGITVNAYSEDNSDGYVCTATTGQTATGEDVTSIWTLTINDIKDISGVNLNDGANIVVTYTAHLNENAFVNHESGTTTNANKVKLSYSNNPNAGGSGNMGETPEDTVWVFTYEVDNTKYKDDVAEGNALVGAGFRLYDSAGTTEIGLIYDNTLLAYRPVKTGETAVEMISAEGTGKFNIKGLDAGTYVLKETTTPEGYNTCEPVTVVISASHTENTEGTSATTTLTNDSNVTNNIVNKSGATLPETGGIGTTIFYVVGIILVLGAGLLLITKKRMSAQK